VLIGDSGVLEIVLDVLPFSQGAQLLFDGIATERPFDTGAISWLVLVAWTVAGFFILARVASRREA
jgi:hypothetical protein